ncbi:hypothetical protein VaNZ11_000352 [Volvox africanus]|uniref:Uncharacterized protein n=1 Tax=Volvox africanus TaxID=51714 RepID=A0ABQ5RLY5_9CHLO|nr:hypothetical protein VaNZ11_000352 [Volvox africanus]
MQVCWNRPLPAPAAYLRLSGSPRRRKSLRQVCQQTWERPQSLIHCGILPDGYLGSHLEWPVLAYGAPRLADLAWRQPGPYGRSPIATFARLVRRLNNCTAPLALWCHSDHSTSAHGNVKMVFPDLYSGRITPLKLARLSEVLRLPVMRVETILQRSPAAVRHMEPEHVAHRLKELCLALYILPKQAAFMVSKQPAYMLLTPLSEIHAKIQQLSNTLGVPPTAVLRTALTVPSILRRSTAFTERRVKAYSTLLRCTPLDVLHIMARGPEYLSDTPSSVRQRMTALGYVLRRPQCTIVAMLQARPDLAFMSGKVMNTKVNGLMCIMDKQKHHVVTLAVKLPALLRCNLDNVRHAFGGLQELLQKREGFVYAMICHAPRLLLLTPRSLHQRCAALQRCLATSPEWREQFTQLRPPGVAQLVLNRRGSLSAMMYLTQRRRAGTAHLAQLLSSSPDGGLVKVLGEGWPDFLEWMDRRRQYITYRMRQHRATMRMAAEGVARAGPAALQMSVNGSVPQLQVPLPPLKQEERGMLQRRGQHQKSLSPVAAVTSQVLSGGAAAATAIGIHLYHEAGGLEQHAQQGIVGSPHLTLQPRPADSSLKPSEDCSCSNRDHLHIKSNNLSSRDDECSLESISQQDAGAYVAAGERQQSGASTSGRQLSWLQLQAEYRRSLQSRARRKAASAFQQLARTETEAPPGIEALPPMKRIRSIRRTAQMKGTNPPMPISASEGLPASPDERGRPLTGWDGSGKASTQRSQQLAGASPALEPSSPHVQPQNASWAVAFVAAGVGATGVSELRAAHGNEPWEALHTADAALCNRDLDRLKELTCLHPIGDGRQSHNHDLSTLLSLGRLQQPNPGLAQAKLGNNGATTTDSSDGLDLEGEAFGATLTASCAAQLTQHVGSCFKRDPENTAGAGETMSTEGNGAGSSWPSEASTQAVGPHHVAEQGARQMPLWLHLEPSGIRRNVSDQGDLLGRAHQGESEVASCRRGAVPPAEVPQHGPTDEVVLVSGGGSICDIRSLGRDTHALNARGQETAGGVSIGQKQKRESTLGAIMPR